MDLYRKYYSKLLEWKSKTKRLPLLIRGLRQIGKSYLAEKFAFENYGEEYCPVLDFRHNKSLFSVFDPTFDERGLTVDGIVSRLRSFFPEKKIERGKTCFVMDEVGDCPWARESFKLFGDNSGFDIIATGSLLGLSKIRGNVNDIPVGYEEYLDMKPLDFVEFLIASGVSEDALEKIRSCVSTGKEMDPAIHLVLNAHLRRYILVGGMPKVVTTFLETQNLNQVRDLQCAICKDFEDDFGKYRAKNGNVEVDPLLLLRTLRAYHSIPDQLAKENKKFKYSVVEGGGRSSEFSDAIAWLDKMDIVKLAHNVRAIETPLSGNSITEEFKLYPSDIGLLLCAYPESIVNEIICGNLGAYKGAIYEGLAADMLDKAGFPLFYYSDTKRHLENDFFVESKEGIFVIESKATNGKMASSKALMAKKTPYRIQGVYKLSGTNFGKGAYYQSLPQYAFPFLLEKISSELRGNLKLETLPKI